jgi:predicted MFS family arabinose efflux permease
MLGAVTDVPPGTLERVTLRRVVAVLSTTEIVSWGVLYYAFPVLLTSISRDTGWSPTLATLAFSVSQIVAAVVGIAVGRVIDRSGPRIVMTFGSVLAVPSLLLIAGAPSYVLFLCGWTLAGIAMAGILYPPAFVALTRWAGDRRVSALTAVTLVGGLASTVFAPLTAFINGALGWRSTYLVLAAVLALVTIPLHWIGLRHPWPARPGHHDLTAEQGRDLTSTKRSRHFALLAIALSAASLTGFAVVVNLVPLLEERGLTSELAAVALGLGGVGQFVGRFAYPTITARVGTSAKTAVVILGVAAAVLLLAIVPGPAALLVALAVLVGMTRGLVTLIQATAVSERWGTAGFGNLNGMLSAPMLTCAAVAPFVGSWLAAVTGSYSEAFLILGVIAVLGGLASLGANPSPGRR